MITDTQLSAALDRAAGEFEVPTGGADRILELTAAEQDPAAFADPALLERRVRRRRVVAASATAAAAAAIIAVVAIVAGSTGNPGQIKRLAVSGNLVPARVPHAAAGAASAPAGSFAANGPTATIGTTAPVAPPTGAGKSTAAGSATPAKIASSGTLRLTVARASIHGDVIALGTLATRLGGYVSSTDVAENKKGSGGTLEIAVPAPSFTSVITGAERLGTTRSLVTRSSDVTKQYSDTTAQITALDDVRAQLESFLKRTGKVSDLLAVEQQIEGVQSQIDVLESERSSLDQEVTYATLVVNLVVNVPPAHKPTARSGLSKAWSKAISGFTGGLKWLLGVSGAMLFALIVLAALGLAGFVLVRRALPRLRRHFL